MAKLHDPRSLSRLARRQLDDYRARHPGTLFAEPAFTMDLQEAYALQLEVARLREADGERRAGYKVGCTSARIHEQFGMSGPISGFVWASELHQPGAQIPAAAYTNLGVEAELAVRIGPEGEPAAMLTVVELHNHVFRAEPRVLSELIANNGLHAGVVPAPGPEQPFTPDLDARRISLEIGGESVEAGVLGDVPGGPRTCITWLRGHLEALDMPLREGDLVLTSTPLGIHPVQPGDEVVARIDGLAPARARVV